MIKQIFGLMAFLLFSFSYLIGYAEESTYHMLMPIKGVLILLSAVLFFLSVDKESSDRIKRSYSTLNIVILIYEILLMVAVGKTIFLIRDYPAILNSIVWTTCPVINLIRFRSDLGSVLCGLLKDKTRNILIMSSFITASIIIILSREPEGVRFTWDSDTLYQLIYSRSFESLYDAKLLTFHSHVSIVYAHILVLLNNLIGNIRTAYFVLNSLCIIAASFGMTFLLKNLVPDKKVAAYIVCNAMFMFSPWVLGMSTYYIYDYYIWCLTPLLLYFAFKRDWIWFCSLGVMITFSKATGLVVFGSVCAGILITDIFNHTSRNNRAVSKHKILQFVTDLKYWLFASPALVFLVFFKRGIASDIQFEDTRFGFDASHILHQLKLFFTSNFIWIFVIATIFLLFLAFIFKKIAVSHECLRLLQILLISDFLFIIFNCFCITYRLPRYMDSHIAAVYICTSVLILTIDTSALYSLGWMITAISLVGSFRMIDPVSLLLYSNIAVGDHNIVDFETSDTPSLEDSVICNREYYSYEVVLSHALKDVLEEKIDTDEIMFSLGNDPLTWGFSGGRYSYGYNDGKRYFEEFYDTSIPGYANGYDYEYYNDPCMIPFSIRYVFPNESVTQAVNSSESGVFYYLYMPTLNENRENEIRELFNVIDEKDFEYRGWIMNCIRFSK